MNVVLPTNQWRSSQKYYAAELITWCVRSVLYLDHFPFSLPQPLALSLPSRPPLRFSFFSFPFSFGLTLSPSFSSSPSVLHPSSLTIPPSISRCLSHSLSLSLFSSQLSSSLRSYVIVPFISLTPVPFPPSLHFLPSHSSSASLPLSLPIPTFPPGSGPAWVSLRLPSHFHWHSTHSLHSFTPPPPLAPHKSIEFYSFSLLSCYFYSLYYQTRRDWSTEIACQYH